MKNETLGTAPLGFSLVPIQVLVLQRSCKLFGVPETRAESLGCGNHPLHRRGWEREEERIGDAVMAGPALPKLSA